MSLGHGYATASLLRNSPIDLAKNANVARVRARFFFNSWRTSLEKFRLPESGNAGEFVFSQNFLLQSKVGDPTFVPIL